MSEAELNAMIDAMAAQVGHGMSPSSSISPISQLSPISGSPSSIFPTPIGSRIGSATYPNRALASGSPTAGDPSLTIGGRISAAAFKRPASKMLVLPSNPRPTRGDTTSKLSTAPSVHPRVLSPPEPRRSTEEVEQAISQRADTPSAPNIQANRTPSPPMVTPVQPAEHISPTPPFPTPSEITANTSESSPPPATTSIHYSKTTLPPPGPPPPFPMPVPPAPQTSEMDFEMISTPEYKRDELSLKPGFTPMETSTVSPYPSVQATDSPRNHESLVPQEGDKSVDVPLPPGAGPTRRLGDVVLPDSLLPGGRRDSPTPSISSERGHSRPSSGSFNNIPASLRPGTPRSASPAQQNFTGVGSLAHTNKEGSKRPSNSPPSTGAPSLMPLDLYSPILDFGNFGDGAAGQPQKAPSNAGYGEGKFMTNLEDEDKQEKKADPKRSSGNWR